VTGNPTTLARGDIRERLHAAIPGGAHTYAKGDDQWPEEAPVAIVRGEGCHVWDTDGNRFVEFGMGLRSVSLGHAHPRIVEAVERQLRSGTNFGRPATIELHAAEALLALLPAADMVKFCKDGSTATTAAVKLARAYTGRDLVALCADQPFFSYDDWFIATTPTNAGIPQAIAELTLTFRYNDLAGLEALFAAHPEGIACVILEAEREIPPAAGFLEGVQELCARHGAVFVLDEMITGFRWHIGGAQAVYGLTPDLSVFGKGMANGFSVSALAGRGELMELGGLRTEKPRVFLLSTTHGAETTALAAAIETIAVYQEEDVIAALSASGERLAAGFSEIVTDLGISDHLRLAGKPCNLVYETRAPDGTRNQAYRTLFMQELLRQRVLAPSFVVAQAHDAACIDLTLEAIAKAATVYACALRDGVDAHLSGRAVKPVQRRYA
jgi:glutamate-1-semialdehyde 2,1-aminomutase